jgi:hypothetical protein
MKGLGMAASVRLRPSSPAHDSRGSNRSSDIHLTFWCYFSCSSLTGFHSLVLPVGDFPLAEIEIGWLCYRMALLIGWLCSGMAFTVS